MIERRIQAVIINEMQPIITLVMDMKANKFKMKGATNEVILQSLNRKQKDKRFNPPKFAYTKRIAVS